MKQPPDPHICARIQALARQMADERGVLYNQIPATRTTVQRAVTTGNVSLSSFARICRALGYTLVLNVRRETK